MLIKINLNCFFTSANVHWCRGLFNVVTWLVYVGWWVLCGSFTLWVGVGVNRSYAEILGNTKKSKSKGIFWFFTFLTVCTPKNSGTRHSEWEKIINFTFFVILLCDPSFLLQILCWVRICKQKTVKYSVSTENAVFKKKFHPFL